MKLSLLLFGMLILFFQSEVTLAQQAKTLTLESAIQFGMEHSLTIKNAQIDIVDAQQQIVENRAIGLPKLDLGVDYRYNLQLPASLLPARFIDPNAPADEFAELKFGTKNTVTATLNFSSSLFDGTWFVALKAAKVFRDFTTRQYIATQQTVKNDVIQAYLPALIVKENQSILDKNIANLEKLLFETKQLYKEGFAEQLDVDRLELSLANLKVDRDNLNRNLETALNFLKFTIGYPVDEPLEVSDDIHSLLVEATPEELNPGVDYNSRAEYAAAKLNINLNELNINRFRAGYLPTLEAFGSYSQNFQGDKLSDAFRFPSSLVGLRFSLPIFDGLQKKAQIQRAKLDMEQAINQKIQLERSITLEVENARSNYINAKQATLNQQRTLDLAQKIYDTTQIKYKEGVGSSLELTQAEQGLYDAQRNYTQTLYDLLVAKANLNKALGK